MVVSASQGGGKSLGFTNSRRIGLAKAREITVIDDFTDGYRNREDTSYLSPKTLVAGSHDVLVNRAGTIQSRMGYIMDGAQSSVVSPIRAPFDWISGTGYIHHFRAGFLTSAGNDGKLQFRYVDTYGALGGAVNQTYWLDFLTGLTSTYFQYAPLYESSSLTLKLLMVNRTNRIWEWNGAITTINGNTPTTITTDGTKTFSQLGFYFSVQYLGYTTTVYNLSNPVAGTVRFTYSSGTNPNITSATMPVGTIIVISNNSSSVPTGQYAVTNVQANYFEITASGGTGTYTGQVQYDYNYNSGLGYSIVVNGNVYSYLGGALSTTLTGLSGLPTFTQHYPMWQNGGFQTFSGPSKTITFNVTPTPSINFTCDLIGIIQSSNQVLVASIAGNQVYMSKAGTYTDFSQSSARLQYEGDMFTTLGTVKAFQPQEDSVYVSAGINEWYTTKFDQTTIANQTTGTTLIYENAKLQQLKTASLQAAQSQYASTKIANNVVFLSNEPIVRSLGRVDNILGTPQISDLSFPIQNDIDAYNPTDAWMAYNKEFLYVGFPAMGLFRIYNMTNPKKPFWEAPQNIALSGISFIGTTVIGHSYQTSESYVLNTGYSDRAISINQTGLPISWAMVFAFQTSGLRAKRKSFNKFFVEGYIGTACNVNVGLVYRSPTPGIIATQTIAVNGNASYVLSNRSQVSLGKSSLGKNSLGGDIQYPSQFNLPPYFAVLKTTTRQPYLAYQPQITGYGVNQVFELLAYGNNSAPTSENEADITI